MEIDLSASQAALPDRHSFLGFGHWGENNTQLAAWVPTQEDLVLPMTVIWQKSSPSPSCTYIPIHQTQAWIFGFLRPRPAPVVKLNHSRWIWAYRPGILPSGIPKESAWFQKSAPNKTYSCLNFTFDLKQVLNFFSQNITCKCFEKCNTAKRLIGLLPCWLGGREPTCQCRGCKRRRFDPWVRKIPWRRARQPTPVFLPGESHGQRSLVDYSLWGHRVRHNWSDLAQHRRKVSG